MGVMLLESSAQFKPTYLPQKLKCQSGHTHPTIITTLPSIIPFYRFLNRCRKGSSFPHYFQCHMFLAGSARGLADMGKLTRAHGHFEGFQFPHPVKASDDHHVTTMNIQLTGPMEKEGQPTKRWVWVNWLSLGNNRLKFKDTSENETTSCFYRNLSNILWSDGENPERCLHVTTVVTWSWKHNSKDLHRLRPKISLDETVHVPKKCLSCSSELGQDGMWYLRFRKCLKLSEHWPSHFCANLWQTRGTPIFGVRSEH